VPSITAAATVAMCNGLTITSPRPSTSAALAASSAGAGKRPPSVLRPTVYSALKPNRSAAAVIASAGSPAVASTKAVLHDWANATPNVTAPRLLFSKLRNSWPPALAVSGQFTCDSGVVPLASRALPETILNVEPGRYSPANARL
jgi:hypothetical protein